MDQPFRFPFRRRQRLSGRRAFAAVFDAAARRAVGPLLVFARANELPHSRLGLSVSRRVGNAVKRNRIKRYLREAFRLQQHDLPTGYDFVLVVRPHEVAELADYQRMLRKAAEGAVVQYKRKRPQADKGDDAEAPSKNTNPPS